MNTNIALFSWLLDITHIVYGFIRIINEYDRGLVSSLIVNTYINEAHRSVTNT